VLLADFGLWAVLIQGYPASILASLLIAYWQLLGCRLNAIASLSELNRIETRIRAQGFFATNMRLPGKFLTIRIDAYAHHNSV